MKKKSKIPSVPLTNAYILAVATAWLIFQFVIINRISLKLQVIKNSPCHISPSTCFTQNDDDDDDNNNHVHAPFARAIFSIGRVNRERERKILEKTRQFFSSNFLFNNLNY